MSRSGITIAVVLALTALVVQDTTALSQEDAQEQRLIDTVCAIPPVLLERTLHGHRDDRAGEIQLLTREPDFVGHGGLPHSGPWDYVGRVPLLWYGPATCRRPDRSTGVSRWPTWPPPRRSCWDSTSTPPTASRSSTPWSHARTVPSRRPCSSCSCGMELGKMCWMSTPTRGPTCER